MKNIQLISLVLVGAALLAACKVEYPFYCETNEDCSEHAYCHKQVCMFTACKEDTDCLGAQTCGGAGVSNVCGCSPLPHAPTETAKYNWESAKSACQGLGNGWRLPTKAELDSIVDHYKDYDHGNWSSLTINTKAFPDTPRSGFWTASDEVGSGSAAVSFNNDHSFWGFETISGSVRCVR